MKERPRQRDQRFTDVPSSYRPEPKRSCPNQRCPFAVVEEAGNLRSLRRSSAARNASAFIRARLNRPRLLASLATNHVDVALALDRRDISDAEIRQDEGAAPACAGTTIQ